MHIVTDMCAATSVKTESKRNVENNSNANVNNNKCNKTHKKDESPYLTPENFIERTVDGLLAEHPGELIKTGSPHVVSV